MRIRQTMTRAAAVSASALLVAGLAACGGSDGGSSSGSGDAANQSEGQADGGSGAEGDAQASPGDICEATDLLTEMSSAMSDVDPSNLQPTLDQLEELTSTVEGVEAPAEVAGDWETMATSLRGVTDSLQGAVDNPTDTEAMAKVSEAMSALSDESFQKAGKAVSTYTAENC